ncbi:MAG: N-acetylmuramoyl-L-alanine amidase [Lachnospiraceae bacterium]|nr:N-acetylmuramoyl-L-alanine amidase [Lachnospiraceae bacterium]
MSFNYRFHKMNYQYKGALRVGLSLLLFFMFFLCFSKVNVSAKELTLKYNGKKQVYTGAQVSVMLDKKTVKTASPGLLLSDNVCVNANDVIKKGMKCTYTFDSKKNTITISKFNTKLVLTLNKKTAYVNDKKVKLEVAPRKIYFKKYKKTYVYVPLRFVAENIGYNYVWNSEKSRSQLNTPQLVRFGAADEYEPYKDGAPAVKYNNSAINYASFRTIKRDGVYLVSAKSFFPRNLKIAYTYDSATGAITLTKGSAVMRLSLNSTEGVFKDKSVKLPTAPVMMQIKNSKTKYLMLPIKYIAGKFGYSYKYTAQSDTITISKKDMTYYNQKQDPSVLEKDTTVSNVFEDITANYSNKQEYIKLTSKNPVAPVIDYAEGLLTLRFSGMYSDFEAVTQTFSDYGEYIDMMQVIGMEHTVTVIVKLKEGATYYCAQAGNVYNVILCAAVDSDSSYQLRIPIPETVSFSKITTKDNYNSKQYKFIIPGDIRKFLKNNLICYNNTNIKKVSYGLNASKNTEITVSLSKIQGFKLDNCGAYIGVTVDDPMNIYSRIVVLDAGHGGYDSGATSKGVKEKDLNLKILYTRAKAYFDAKNSNIKAYWTRTTDTFVPLYDRAAFAKQTNADLFISLHMNSAGSAANGTEVLYADNNKNKLRSLTSKKMATIFDNQLIGDLKMHNRGIVNRPNLVVLKYNTVPSVLIELGFITNKKDIKKLKSASFQKRAAKSIYDATGQIFSKYPTKR